MKKTIFCCLISSFLAANSYAQAVDLFDDDNLTSPKQNEAKTEENVQFSDKNSETIQDNDSADKNTGMLSFITKPISLLFSANDKVTASDGKRRQT